MKLILSSDPNPKPAGAARTQEKQGLQGYLLLVVSMALLIVLMTVAGLLLIITLGLRLLVQPSANYEPTNACEDRH